MNNDVIQNDEIHRNLLIFSALSFFTMKYGELLKKLCIPEWRDQYIDYDELKKTVKRLKAVTNDIHILRKSISLLQPIDVDNHSEHELNVDAVADPDLLDQLIPIPVEVKAPNHKIRSVLYSRERSHHFSSAITFHEWDLQPILNSIHRAIHQENNEHVSDEIKEQIFDLEKTFVLNLEREINKISAFYCKQKLYFAQKCEHLFEELRSYRNANRNKIEMAVEEEGEIEVELKGDDDDHDHDQDLEEPAERRRSLDSTGTSLDIPISEKKRLKKQFRITYHGLVSKFSSYRIVNMTAITKICKKHDKNSMYHFLQKDVLKMLRAQSDNFGSNKSEKYLLDRLENAYARYLSDHNKKIYGVQTLRKLDPTNPAHTASINEHRAKWCGIGFLWGGSISMLVNCIVLLLIDPKLDAVDRECSFWKCTVTERASHMMSGSVCICFYLWLWALNLYIFESQRFNHCFIFEADPTSLLHSQNVFALCAVLSSSVTVMIALYIISFYFWSAFPLHSVALMLFIFWILFAIYPGNRYRKTRQFVRQSVWRILLSPFSSVYFIDFFIADQLTSLFIIIVNFGQSLCGFIAGDLRNGSNATECDSKSMALTMNILKILPYWWRFAQCLRRYYDDRENRDHLVNGGKYLSSIITVLVISAQQHVIDSTPLLMLRLSFGAISTLYAFLWDVLKDWSLGNRQHRFLRKELRFPPLAYYVVVGADFVFRVSWAFALFIDADHLQYLKLPLAAIEILRRCIWNVFRLENEHLNNCGKFRVVHDVPALNVLGFDEEQEED